MRFQARLSAIILGFILSSVALAAVNKVEFKKNFKEKGAPKLCSSAQGMMQKCFSFSDSECVGQMSAAIDQCNNDLTASMPDTITGADGGRLGAMIGKCAMKQFAVKNSGRLDKSENCQKFSLLMKQESAQEPPQKSQPATKLETKLATKPATEPAAPPAAK